MKNRTRNIYTGTNLKTRRNFQKMIDIVNGDINTNHSIEEIKSIQTYLNRRTRKIKIIEARRQLYT